MSDELGKPGNSAVAHLQLRFRPLQPWRATLPSVVAIFLNIFSNACSLLLLHWHRPLGSVAIVCYVALNYTFVVTKTSCCARSKGARAGAEAGDGAVAGAVDGTEKEGKEKLCIHVWLCTGFDTWSEELCRVGFMRLVSLALLLLECSKLDIQ